MRTLLLAGLALVASTAVQAQSIQCAFLTERNTINRDIPPVVFHLHPAEETSTGADGTKWNLGIETQRYVLARTDRSHTRVVVVIEREGAQSWLGYSRPGKPWESTSLYCTKAELL